MPKKEATMAFIILFILVPLLFCGGGMTLGQYGLNLRWEFSLTLGMVLGFGYLWVLLSLVPGEKKPVSEEEEPESHEADPAQEIAHFKEIIKHLQEELAMEKLKEWWKRLLEEGEKEAKPAPKEQGVSFEAYALILIFAIVLVGLATWLR